VAGRGRESSSGRVAEAAANRRQTRKADRLATAATFRQGIYRNGSVRRLARWLDALPDPPLAIEFGTDRLAAIRWARNGSIDDMAVESLPPRAIVPSAVEPNLAKAESVRTAMACACRRLRAVDEDVALLLPDPVIRVFVQHFEEFPRSHEEALPMLRWKLKKSVPFGVDETLLSYMRQAARRGGVDVLSAFARLCIVREYEELAESAGLRPGVVLSSSLAAVALLEEQNTTLLARVSDSTLTTSIVRNGMLCGYRSTELPAHSKDLTPQMLLEEIFPAAVYYREIWNEGIQSMRVAGLSARLPEFVETLQGEFHCPVKSLLHSAVLDGRIPEEARPLVENELEGLAGWMMYRR
jgi:type IV pilus assembly protein PilM